MDTDAIAALLRSARLGRVVAVEPLTQGAVGTVARVRRAAGSDLVVKTYPPAFRSRADVEVTALQALASRTTIPAPPVLAAGVHDGVPHVVMPLLLGDRLDRASGDRLPAFAELGRLLRRLHEIEPPPELPVLPPTSGVAEYAARNGPCADRLAARASDLSSGPAAFFCHGDLSDANVLVTGGAVSGIVDWERAARTDPLRDLARATFHAGRKDAGAAAALIAGYGLPVEQMPRLELYELIHAAELWNWLTATDDVAGAARVSAELMLRAGWVPARCTPTS